MSAATRIRRTPFTALMAAGVVVIAVAAALVAWAYPSGGSAPRPRIEGAYVPQPASPDVAAAYFTIVNSGDAADTLTGVRSDVSGDTMMHRTVGERMQMAADLPIPAHDRLVFAPGGYHVMIEKPVRRLRAGDHVTLMFIFRKSAAITVRAPVEPVGYRPDGG